MLACEETMSTEESIVVGSLVFAVLTLVGWRIGSWRKRRRLATMITEGSKDEFSRKLAEMDGGTGALDAWSPSTRTDLTRSQLVAFSATLRGHLYALLHGHPDDRDDDRDEAEAFLKRTSFDAAESDLKDGGFDKAWMYEDDK